MYVPAMIAVCVVVVMTCYCMIVGLDLRKFISWLYGAISFICGVVFGLLVNSTLMQSLKLGAMFGIFLLVAGTMTRPYLEKFGLPKRWEKGDPLSLGITKLIGNLRNRE